MRYRRTFSQDRFLFIDNFAGAVIDTRWTKTDTESKLGITAGKLDCTGGKAVPAFGDPMLIGPSMLRYGGMTLECEITPTATNTWCNVGFAIVATPSATQWIGLRFDNNGTITLLEDGTTATSTTYSSGNSYKVRVMLKSVGAEIWLKAGSGTWSRLSDTLTNASSPIYPGYGNNDKIFTSEYCLVAEERPNN